MHLLVGYSCFAITVSAVLLLWLANTVNCFIEFSHSPDGSGKIPFMRLFIGYKTENFLSVAQTLKLKLLTASSFLKISTT
jgi:hypothetical protein